MNTLRGKVAMITGGARGQGRAVAELLAGEGADIVLCDLVSQIDSVPYPMADADDLEQTRELIGSADRRCIAVEADARDGAAMRAVAERAAAELGGVDILVVNHGIGIPGSWDSSDEVFDDTLAVNLRGAFVTCRAVIPHLLSRGSGSIVLTASVASFVPFYGMTPYVVSKHALIGLMRSLSAELAPTGIRVNAVCPGIVNTPMIMNDTVLSMFSGLPTGGTPATAAFAAQSLGLLNAPWVESRDVAQAVRWLASDEARYVTGVALPVDLGALNQPPGIPPIAAQAFAALNTST